MSETIELAAGEAAIVFRPGEEGEILTSLIFGGDGLLMAQADNMPPAQNNALYALQNYLELAGKQ